MNRMIIICWLTALAASSSRAEDARFEQIVGLKNAGIRAGRSLFVVDPIQARVAAGTWQAPVAGQQEKASESGGQAPTWEAVEMGPEGQVEHPSARGGYLSCVVRADAEKPMILEARGHGMVYVNGHPRAGDPYDYGFLKLPVLLKPGENHFLFQGGRGRLQAKLVEPRAPAMLEPGDATLPDLLAGQKGPSWAALPLLNATNEPLRDLMIEASCEGGGQPVRTVLPVIPALTARKIGFLLAAPATAAPGEEVKVTLTLKRQEAVLDSMTLTLAVRGPEDSRRCTFISEIDGSVQFYGLRPAVPVCQEGDDLPALVLTLHGASVDALGQVNAYSSKSWAHLVAPTNRRPYGFDWEDWGRTDGLEVLEQASKQLRFDPARTYLTGHSMGGHGAWHLGTTFPDRFAAIGPSAGWVSFSTYGTRGRSETQVSPLRALVERGGQSDPKQLATNLAGLGVFVLHGTDDDNVPVGQARLMVERLSEFHRDWRAHEQPQAGHWWDVSDEPGADCVDWAPMFDFFARRARPVLDAVRAVDFTTVNPAVSASAHWLTIHNQRDSLKPSRARLQFDPGTRRFTGSTENVARLSLDVGGLLKSRQPIRVSLDDQDTIEIPWPEATNTTSLWLERVADGSWRPSPKPPASDKGPHRGGPFKHAFGRRVILVYGTQGTDEENRWAQAKARFDAESFWYRGNGSLDVVPDSRFDPAAEPDRNVILYGNAATNAAWQALVAECPVQVERDAVKIDGRRIDGADLACLFVRPRPGSDQALVGVVSGTGMPGMRLADRLPYFVSGVGVPDFAVLGPELLEGSEQGVRAAGFFGNDWSVAGGEFLVGPGVP